MIQDAIRDEALSQAKRRMDPEVTATHVLLAILSVRATARPEFDGWMAVVSDALGPNGDSIDTPVYSEEAEAFIARCETPEGAVATARELLTEYGFDVPIADATDGSKSAGESAKANAVPVAVEIPVDDSLEAALADLDELVGIEQVKTNVASLVDTHRMNSERAARGLPAVPLGLHLVFTGSPGTGKTTVARIVARIYRHIGLLPKGHLVEVDRSGLVAAYVGQTALQVQRVVKSAHGGVLFIDEAYALAPKNGDQDFGAEAVATLVKAMEDARGSLAVIAAGYNEDMARFISSNAGLRSRFERFIEFPDYSTAELVEIFRRRAAENEIGVDDAVLGRVGEFLDAVPPEVRAGNARLVRNLFEDMYARMARRAAADGVFDTEEISAFVVDDVPQVTTDMHGDVPTGMYL